MTDHPDSYHEGAAACRSGLPLHRCPYGENDTRRVDWMQGWHDAEATAPIPTASLATGIKAARCDACEGTRKVRDIMGSARPCSRCDPAGFNQWSHELWCADRRENLARCTAEASR
ncbi:ribosome modulation factor [Oceanibaculum indicum]|uniref:ribosome modulation factor n=1 Tax=Oceanibaculum indicum TaxID=526216 RepID=UPI0012E9F2B8|nr:Rmf/CrpP family protein [Oceanibaculum indicum]